MSDNVRAMRRSERFSIILPARCRSRTGFVDRVVITDISSGGCCIESCALTVKKGDLVVIQPEGLEGLCGRVRWIDRQMAGIEFAQPLYGPVVEHLRRTHADFLAPLQKLPPLPIRSAA